MDFLKGKGQIAVKCKNSIVSTINKNGFAKYNFRIKLKNGKNIEVKKGYYMNWNDDTLTIKATSESKPGSGFGEFIGKLLGDVISPHQTIKWKKIKFID